MFLAVFARLDRPKSRSRPWLGAGSLPVRQIRGFSGRMELKWLVFSLSSRCSRALIQGRLSLSLGGWLPDLTLEKNFRGWGIGHGEGELLKNCLEVHPQGVQGQRTDLTSNENTRSWGLAMVQAFLSQGGGSLGVGPSGFFRGMAVSRMPSSADKQRCLACRNDDQGLDVLGDVLKV
jgi:hypothetical protein